MSYWLVHELAASGVPVAVDCRVLRISPSGYYEWRDRAPSARAVADAALSAQIVEIHTMSRGTYGVPRVHAELRLGRDIHCGRKRVARLMRLALTGERDVHCLIESTSRTEKDGPPLPCITSAEHVVHRAVEPHDLAE